MVCPVHLKELLIVLVRYPQAGTTKTRLIPLLGNQGAAEFYRSMAKKVVFQAAVLGQNRGVAVEIHHKGGNNKDMTRWLGSDLGYVPQTSGDIGNRMSYAFEQAFRNGWGKVVIIGSDIPDLTAKILGRAFDALDKNELVLGPSVDGGYYLIGLKKTELRLFEGISWSTELVLEQTVNRAAKAGLTLKLVDKLRDVDQPEDLAWKKTSTP